MNELAESPAGAVPGALHTRLQHQQGAQSPAEAGIAVKPGGETSGGEPRGAEAALPTLSYASVDRSRGGTVKFDEVR